MEGESTVADRVRRGLEKIDYQRGGIIRILQSLTGGIGFIVTQLKSSDPAPPLFFWAINNSRSSNREIYSDSVKSSLSDSSLLF